MENSGKSNHSSVVPATTNIPGDDPKSLWQKQIMVRKDEEGEGS